VSKYDLHYLQVMTAQNRSVVQTNTAYKYAGCTETRKGKAIGL